MKTLLLILVLSHQDTVTFKKGDTVIQTHSHQTFIIEGIMRRRGKQILYNAHTPTGQPINNLLHDALTRKP